LNAFTVNGITIIINTNGIKKSNALLYPSIVSKPSNGAVAILSAVKLNTSNPFTELTMNSLFQPIGVSFPAIFIQSL
jgi:hypothetical protein